MLTRVFLAAGVAALAIAAPASAGPGGGHGGGGGNDKGNGGGGPPAAQQGGGGGDHGGGHGRGGDGGGGGPRFDRGGGDHGGGPRFDRGGGGGGGGDRGQRMEMRAPQMQRVERQEMRGFERQQQRGFERQQARQFERQQQRGFERQQMQRAERQRGFERHQEARQMERQRGFERQQARQMERQQARGFERQQARQMERQRGFERQQARNFERQQGGFGQQQARMMERQQAEANRNLQRQQAMAMGQFANNKFAGNAFDSQQLDYVRQQQRNYQQQLDASRFADWNYGSNTQFFAPTVVERFIGVPVQQVANFGTLSPFPASLQYLYPSNDDYYWQYGNGYAYQVDRGDNLIQSLIPLLAGGYLPGSYLPTSYMNSYVPANYGFNGFYQDYNDVCNRYYNGVIYQVDCDDGYVENVIPMYAGGYGVGQMLPSAYSYYNVPTQYRSLYYDNADYGYWYSPGAIYQYDQRNDMITSVAALLSPGFAIGQPLPSGYDAYNVPYDYRQTYYDTPDAWYRYNNGYIYQVDPTSQLVTAIVASLLT